MILFHARSCQSAKLESDPLSFLQCSIPYLLVIFPFPGFGGKRCLEESHERIAHHQSRISREVFPVVPPQFYLSYRHILLHILSKHSNM